MDVARRLRAGGGLVQPRHQRTHQRQPRRVGGAQHQRIAARLGHDGGAVAGVAGRSGTVAAAAGAAAGFDQALHQRHQIGGQRVLQRNDLDVGGARHIERGNDAADALQVVGVVGDDQRVVARVDVDGVVGPDQGPQHRHQVVGRLVVEPEDLGDHRVRCGTGAGTGHHHAAHELGIGLRHHLVEPAGVHQREALQPQRRRELVDGGRRRDRPVGGQRDLPLHPGIDHHVAAGDGRHGAGHRLDLGAHEVQRHRLVAAHRLGLQRQAGQAQGQQRAGQGPAQPVGGGAGAGRAFAAAGVGARGVHVGVPVGCRAWTGISPSGAGSGRRGAAP